MFGREKILIVDDLEQNLIALEALLEDCNAEIHRATTGTEALATLLKHDFALVLLDVQMPGMDGFEVAELMRLNAHTRHIPIIFVTAISKEQRYVFKGYQAGAVDYLAKPIDPVVLRSKVNVFLELWRNRQELAEVLAEKVRLSEKLRQQAQFDALTGLPNRALFLDRLRQAMLMTGRSRCTEALMFIDLDRFKLVNDTLGHEAGDKLLVQVAQRLLGCVRKTDTVARMGGDEFTVILQNLAEGMLVENIANNIIRSLAATFDLEGEKVDISASIGITLFPQDSTDSKKLLINADSAMYQAKEAGCNTFRFFTPEMNARLQETVTLEKQLITALERDEFTLHYQPQVDLTRGRIVGVEALVRWEQPDGQLVYPNDFIPLSERSGLITLLGKWVLRHACLQTRKWLDAGHGPLRIGVNISARHLNARANLLHTVREVLDESGIGADSLALEITETAVMVDMDSALETLERLRGMGVKIALDDFGTGHSSLSVLKRFPIQTIKIDKSFVRDLSVDEDDAAIVSAIVSIAHKLGLRVVAEGVEEPAQLAFLEQEGCHEVQGFHFSRPLSAEDCTVLLQERHDST